MVLSKTKKPLIILVLAILIGAIYSFYSKEIKNHTVEFINKHLDFKLERIIYEQNNRFCLNIKNLEMFEKYLNTQLFEIPIDKEKEKLKLIECLNSVTVSRIIPKTLVVKVTEKNPIAIWQNEKKHYFITDNKEVISIYNTNNLEDFLIVTGKNANLAIEELFQIIDYAPIIKEHISSAIYIGERRWNIRLKNGLEIKLPAQLPLEAWKEFTSLSAKKDLFSKKNKIKTLDFRIRDKLVVS
ncbi:MAG: cell division protein FtsQ/DivIB [Rickettsiales bacterium]